VHRSQSGVMAKTVFKNSKRNSSRWPYTSHFTDEVTPECLFLAATAVKHSLDNWAGGSFLCVTFEVYTYKGMENSILNTQI